MSRNHALDVEMQTLQLQVCLPLLLLQGVAVLQCRSVMSHDHALEVEMQTLQLQVRLCVLQCVAWRMIAQHSVLQCVAVC